MTKYSPEETALLIAFGLRLKELRLQQKLSQEELSDMTDLHRTYIGSAERGERNVSILNLQKLAQALNVSVDRLMVD